MAAAAVAAAAAASAAANPEVSSLSSDTSGIVASPSNLDIVSNSPSTIGNASNSPSNSEALYLRYTEAVLSWSPRICREFFRVYLERVFSESWDDGALWKRWCLKNQDVLRSYDHLDGLSGETIGEKFVPVFESCDLSLFRHIFEEEIQDDDVKMAVESLLAKRYLIVVDEGKEMTYAESKKAFEDLKRIVHVFFKDFSQSEDEWLYCLDGLKLGRMDEGLEEMRKKWGRLKTKSRKAKKTLRDAVDELMVKGVLLEDDQGEDGDMQELIAEGESSHQKQIGSETRAMSAEMESFPNLSKIQSKLNVERISCPMTKFNEDDSVPKWPGSHFGHLVFIINGLIHIWGGINIFNYPTNFMWIFDHITNSWSRIKTQGNPPHSSDGSFGVWHKGVLYVYNIDGLYSYTNATRTWSEIMWYFSKPVRREFHVGWSDGRDLYFFGGNLRDGEKSMSLFPGGDVQDGCTNQLLRFSPTFSRWFDETKGRRPTPRERMGVAKLKEKVYIFGGVSDSPLNDMWCYDTKWNEWTEISLSGSKPSPRSGLSLTRISQRHFIIIGGHKTQATHATWIFDAETKEMISLATESFHIWNHQTVFLDGKVYVFGGGNNNDIIKIKIE